MDRRYDSKHYSSNKVFGVRTEHDISGSQTKSSLVVPDKDVDNERVARFQQRRKDLIGIPLDPIKDSMKVSEDHCFGLVELPDDHDVAYLLHKGSFDVFKTSLQNINGIIKNVRLSLKKANYCKFESLQRTFSNDRPARVLHNLQKCLFPISDDQLASILVFFTDENGQVDTKNFLNALDWRLPLTIPENFAQNAVDEVSTARNYLSKMSDAIDDELNSTYTKDWNIYGVPSLRSDLPPPRIRRVADKNNYGDEGTAGVLTNPSIMEAHGVFTSDLYEPRTMTDILSLYKAIGFEVDISQLEKLWEKHSDSNSELSFVDVSRLIESK